MSGAASSAWGDLGGVNLGRWLTALFCRWPPSPWHRVSSVAGVQRTDWSEFEDSLAALYRVLPLAPGVVEPKGHNGADLYLVERGDQPGQVEITLTNGSGKTLFLSAVYEVKRWRPGFSASARALTRAGLKSEMLRTYTTAHEAGHCDSRENDVRTWPTGSAPSAAFTHIDGRSALEKSIGCEPALTLTVGTDANTDATAPRTNEQADASTGHLSGFYEADLQRAAQFVIELGRVLFELAMAARSHCGLLAAPLPTDPPGEIVRSHPRVPRGPDAASGTATFWPTGGMLSMT